MAKLTDLQIIILARKYDLDPRDALVLGNAEQANSFDGQDAGRVSWGTDSMGIFNAYSLLDGYLAEETRSARVDALKHRDFCANAY